jgi:CubicO group peptidase (beta-lactamase class C family)
MLSAQHEDIRKEINKIIRYDTEIDFNEVPGFIVGIMDQDTTFVLGFGEFENMPEAVLTNKIFEVGALSKLFTSSLCQLLAEKGIISLHEPINSYLPAEYQNPRVPHLNLAKLINHFAGMPKRPKHFGKKEKEINNPYKYYTKADLLNFYSEYIPQKQEEKFLYSHLNYALVELVLEFASQQSFEELLQAYIQGPLKMENSFIHFDEHSANLVEDGYNRAGVQVEPWEFQSFAASEGLKTTVGDIFKFAKTHITGAPLTFSHTAFGPTEISKYISIAQGWYKIDNKDADILTHTGKTSGYYAYLGLVKETQTAVTILTNSALGTQDLGYLILRMVNHNWKRKT